MGISYIPCLESDETIYSWCATIHVLSANVKSESTSMELFGITHAARQHDLPSRLGYLLQRTNLCTIGLSEVMRRHTIAGIFMPFAARSDAREDRLHDLTSEEISGASSIASSAISGKFRRVVLCQSRTFDLDFPLRSCPACVDADRARVGRSYWHVSHQWPTSQVCAFHGVSLVVNGRPSKKWLLPSSNICSEEQRVATEKISKIDAIMNALALRVSSLERISTGALRHAAIRRLQMLGVIHSARSVRHDRIARWFQSTETVEWCVAAGNGLEALADGNWLPKLLWRLKQDHPIRWIVLWGALDWSRPEEAVDAFMDSQAGVEVDIHGQMLLFQSDRSIAPLFTPEAVRNAFGKADSYADVMARLNVSRSDIIRWLEADPQLRRHWRERLLAKHIESAIQNLHEIRKRLPGISREGLVELAGADVALLRKHERDTLHHIMATIPARRTVQRSLL